MNAATQIRSAVAQVSLLRDAVLQRPELGQAVAAVKRLQSRRFAGTYPDLLVDGRYTAAVRFFLEELYSDKDYAERDAQFARIAGAIERFFPAQVAQTAVALARLHALTEELDQALATRWLADAGPGASESEVDRYVKAWRLADRRADREKQLTDVVALGREMARLTRTPGLRTMLKMMRRPAVAAGLGPLQRFLETGFDTFAAMARAGGAEEFLGIIEKREAALIASLFDAPPLVCQTQLATALGQAP